MPYIYVLIFHGHQSLQHYLLCTESLSALQNLHVYAQDSLVVEISV
jgi:hypothetical protein